MPIKLQYRHMRMSNVRLASELEEKLAALAEQTALFEKKRDWFPSIFSPHTMTRTFIRHRSAYRAKAAFCGLFWAGSEPPCTMLFAPLFFWLSGRQDREEVLQPFRLYLLRCDVEDLMDELQERIKNGQYIGR